MPKSHTVICTAGHIDHGKSSLIQSLTGYHPDVLKEEQEREMTIDLGFAFYRDDVTFIDVPGHEKFLKTMLAGASGVDGAVLVIAADDGIMPQTVEHFEVLQLMGIERGIIALTKIDLADKDWIELVKDEIHGLTSETFMDDAPIIPVSNRTGSGVEDFRRELDKLISETQPRRDRGLFRLWLDRAFTIKGSGTVVAGTVLSGSVKNGDRVEILPDGVIARVKRIQVHKVDVPHANIGDRAAINLPGIDKDAVKRGDLLATVGHYRPTFMFNARLNLLKSYHRPIENRLRLRLHLGSSEIIGRAILLDREEITPGTSGLVQFRLESQAMGDIGDRYVIRSFSEGRVMGGGTILETHPKKMRHASTKDVERLEKLESAEPREIIRQYLMKDCEKAVDAEAISRETAFLVGDVVDILSAMQRDDDVKVIEPAPKWTVTDLSHYNELKASMLDYLDTFHRENPQLEGARRSDIKSHLMPRTAAIILETILQELAGENSVKLEGELVIQTGFQISFSSDQIRLKESILGIFLDDLFTPPDPVQIAEELNTDYKQVNTVITGLCELGELVRLHGPDGKAHIFHREAIEEARRRLLQFFESHDEMKFFEFRELLGSTRKFTTPIAMQFDTEGITFRDGEVRRLR